MNTNDKLFPGKHEDHIQIYESRINQSSGRKIANEMFHLDSHPTEYIENIFNQEGPFGEYDCAGL